MTTHKRRPGRPPRPSKTKLAKYLTSHGISRSGFAELLSRRAGVAISRQSVGAWAAGEVRPQPIYRTLIEAATKGEVPARVWR